MKTEFEKRTKMEVFKPTGPSPPPGSQTKSRAKPGEGSGQMKASERVFSSQTAPRSQPATAPRQKFEAHPESRAQGRRCRIYWGSGYCRFGTSCRFLHWEKLHIQKNLMVIGHDQVAKQRWKELNPCLALFQKAFVIHLSFVIFHHCVLLSKHFMRM